jgi:O-succinylbenzoic acid--CoA ligase
VISLVAVSGDGRDPVRLRTVEASEVSDLLTDALNGGPPIAPLPPNSVERSRAITMLRPTEAVVEADAAVVVATSGSTGVPKGVVLSRSAIRSSVDATHARLGGIGDWVLALPPYYVAGLMVLARARLTGTRTVPVSSDLTELPRVAGGLSARRYISLVSPQLDRALRRADLAEALASFSSVLVGGGRMSAGLAERAGAAGINVVTTYGMSETCGGCVYDGRPLMDVDIEIANDRRIMIKTASLFSGYRLRPDLTEQAVVNGAFCTQDLGTWQAGRLVVLGRLDDIVIVGGHKVDLGDVERRVQRWATRRQAHAAVVGVPDAVWGTVIVAATDSPSPLEDMQAVVCESLPAYAMPRELIHLDALPWLASGKLDRVAIKSMIMDELAKRQARV